MIDLHTHTTFSDGSLTPTELVETAAAIGLTAVAVTDHDTVDGLPEALAAGERLGFTVVPGVEINVEHDGLTLDMLGYFLRGLPDAALDERLDELRRRRDERNRGMLARLTDLGLPIEQAELAETAGGGAAGRPHIALAMLRHEYVDSIDAAFRLYLRRGAPAYVDRQRLALAEAVDLLRDSGGVAVIAHPGIIHTDGVGLARLVRDAAAAGVVGIECYHPVHDAQTIAACLELAERHDLVATGGSDFHGALKPQVRLGVGPGGMTLPEQLLTNLAARAARLV
jgi:predicted metal-dependent phosphoesterase TrpH